MTNEEPRLVLRKLSTSSVLLWGMVIINRSGPVMIDQETELMPAVGAPGMLNYNYRLVNVSAAQVDYNKFASGAKERLKESACNRPETRDNFLKKGVTLRYSYFDKGKQHIATINVEPADCGY